MILSLKFLTSCLASKYTYIATLCNKDGSFNMDVFDEYDYIPKENQKLIENKRLKLLDYKKTKIEGDFVEKKNIMMK